MLRFEVTRSVHNFFALIIIFWAVVPPVQYSTLYRGIVVLSSILWVLLPLTNDRTLHSDLFLIVLFSIPAILLGFLSGEDLVYSITSRLQIIIFLLFTYMGIFYLKYDWKFLRFAAFFSIAALLIFTAITLREYNITPNISRLLSHSSDISIEYAHKGVGGYGLVYPMIFINSAILYLFASKNVGFKPVLIVCAVIGILLVFKSGYMIACILMVISLAAFIFRMYHANAKTASLMVIVLFSLMYASTFIIQVYDNDIIELFNDSPMYHQKVEDIISSIETDESVGKLEARTSRYRESLTAIIHHPILGSQITDNSENVGGHSTLFDIYALYGVFSIPYYVLIYYAIKNFKEHLKVNGFAIMIVILGILNGIVNTLSGIHGLVFFIVIPGILCYAQEKEAIK